jgi:predicted GTPase
MPSASGRSATAARNAANTSGAFNVGRPGWEKSTATRRLKIEVKVIVSNEAGLSDFHALHSAITRRPQDLYLVSTSSTWAVTTLRDMH